MITWLENRMKRMKRLFLLGVLAVSVSQTAAQQLVTKVVTVELNRKQVTQSYRVFLYANGKKFEAKRTAEGFAVPDELRSENSIDTRIVFGKYDLAFGLIPISRFGEAWRLGINKRPFAEEFVVTPEEPSTPTFIYYVDFSEHHTT